MSRRILILASILCLVSSSCKQDEGGAPTPGGDPETSNPAGTPAAKPDKPAPVPVDPKQFMVAVALEPTKGSKQLLTSGILVAPYAEDDDVVVTCLSPDKTKPRSAHIWSERTGGARWIRIRSMTFDEATGTVILVPGSRPKCELTDLTQPPPLPERATRVLTVAWGESLEPQAESPEEMEQREKQKEMQAEYNAFLREERELNEQMRRRPTSRPTTRTRPDDLRREYEERRQAQSDLRKKIDDLRREAARLDISLRRSSTDYMESPRRKPVFQVQKTNLAIPAGTAEAAANLIITGATDWDNGGLVPGVGLARAHDDGLEAVPLATLRDILTPSIADATAWFYLRQGSAPTLKMTLHSSTVLDYSTKLHLLISPGAEPPTGPDTAPFQASFSKRGDHEHSTSFDTRNMVDDAPAEFQGIITLSRNEQILDSRSFSFSLRKNESGQMTPEWGDASALRLEAPADDSKHPTADLLAELKTEGTIVDVLQTGDPRYLVIVQASPARIRILDIQERQWGKDLAPENAEAVFLAATDAKHLFTAEANSTTVQSYTIPDLVAGASQTLDQPIKAMAAASAVTDGPLLIAHAKGLRLLDPVTLEPSRQIISHGDSSSKITGFGEISWPSHRNNPIQWELAASPNGDQFIAQLHAEDVNGRRSSSTFAIAPGFPSWRIHSGSAAIFGPLGRAFASTSYRDPGSTRTTRPKSGISSSILLPAPNGAMIGLKMPQYRTLPVTPATLAFHRAADDESPLMLQVRAGAWLDRNSRTAPRFSPILVTHTDGVLVSMGANFVLFEQSPDLAAAITLKNRIPAATRGRTWSYQTVDAKEEPLPARILEGPENATADGSDITWKVSGSFPTSLATIKISLGGDKTPTTLSVPVSGQPLSTLHVEDNEEVRNLAPTALFQFEGGIDRILPGPKHTRAYIISGGCRHLTLLDLEKMERGATYSCPTGIASFAIHPTGVIAWHLDRNIVERLSLDDLSPLAIGTADSPIPLAALVCGTSTESGPPVAIFNGIEDHLIFRELNPETFALGTPAGIADLRNSRSNSITPTDYLPTSDNGSIFWIKDHRVTRTGPGKFTSKFISTSSSGSPTTCSGDGLTFLAGTNGFDQETDRKWALNLGENTKTYLFRDFGNRFFLGVHQWRDQNRNYQWRLHLIDSETRDPVYRIEGVPEWENNSRIMTDSQVRDCNAQLYTPAKAILTISQDRFLLFARQLPIDLEE